MPGRDEEFKKSIMAGGRILGGDGDTAFMPQPRTDRVVTFRSCNLILSAAVNPEDTILGYQLTIIDPQEATTYVYRFGEEMREMLEKILGEMPRVGKAVPQDDEG